MIIILFKKFGNELVIDHFKRGFSKSGEKEDFRPTKTGIRYMSKIFKRFILKDPQLDLLISFLTIFIILSISNLGVGY